VQSQYSPTPSRTAHTRDHSWRGLSDEELRHYRREYQRQLATIETEYADAEVRESSRAYLAMLVAGAEAEVRHRKLAAKLGVPIDASRFPDAFVDDLKRRIRLDELCEYELGARLGKVNGAGWRHGDCPLCQHKDCFGVFVGDEAHQRYLCFSCGAGGDAIAAIMQAYGETFRVAIERLCKDARIPLPSKPSTDPRLAALPGRQAR